MFWWVLDALGRPWVKLFLVGPEDEIIQQTGITDNNKAIKIEKMIKYNHYNWEEKERESK